MGSKENKDIINIKEIPFIILKELTNALSDNRLGGVKRNIESLERILRRMETDLEEHRENMTKKEYSTRRCYYNSIHNSYMAILEEYGLKQTSQT